MKHTKLFAYIRSLVPGFTLCLCIVLVATGMQRLPFYPFTVNGHHPIENLTYALILGIVLHPLLRHTSRVQAGVQWCSQTMLSLAIILFGVKLNVALVTHLSGAVCTLVIAALLLCYLLTCWLGRLLRVSRVESALIAFGTAVCGSSAIAALAPALSAEKKQTAVAISVINLFGTIAIFLFPFLGHCLHLSATHFFIWAGASIQAVPQVIAACVTFAPVGSVLGTTVKLVRVLMLAPLLLLVVRLNKTKTRAAVRLPWNRTVPPFIIGFFAVVVMTNSVDALLLSPPWFEVIKNLCAAASSWLMVLAMAGIGLQVSFAELKKTGLQSILLAGAGACFLALFVLLCLSLFQL